MSAKSRIAILLRLKFFQNMVVSKDKSTAFKNEGLVHAQLREKISRHKYLLCKLTYCHSDFRK